MTTKRLSNGLFTALGCITVGLIASLDWVQTTGRSAPEGLWVKSLNREVVVGDYVQTCVRMDKDLLIARQQWREVKSHWNETPGCYRVVKRVWWIGNSVKVTPEGITAPIGTLRVHPLSPMGALELSSREYLQLPAPVWLYSPIADSLDSRYFGSVPQSEVKRLTPIFTRQPQGSDSV